jgi:deoxyhypusine synthase
MKNKNSKQFEIEKKSAHATIIQEGEEPEGKIVKGFEFNDKFDIGKFLASYETTGAQATNLAKAIEIIKKMRKEKAFIYLGYTSNMVTTGIREIIRYLTEHKLIDYLVTTAGGIEEDFIKSLNPFKIGSFEASGTTLRDKSINRAGNIFIPGSRYVEFEKFVLPILKEFHKMPQEGTPLGAKTPADLIKLLGEKINNKESIYYWATKNNIPVHCPAIMDGSLGDMIYFFKNSNPDFTLDTIANTEALNNSTLGKEKTGMIILGGGVVKHCICNANLYRNGADFAVYINTAQEFDGSDSGARPDEAVSWGKISQTAESIKVHGDASIIFPLIVLGAFVN